LWVVSRDPADQQYYFAAMLHIDGKRTNSPSTQEAELYGDYGVVADRSKSRELGRRFPAEGILRALQFETGRPIRHGASIGQSLQTIRFLNSCDELVLDACLHRIDLDRLSDLHQPFGLWTKCDLTFAEYFLTNWKSCREPVAFLLYDAPPALTKGSLVFVHADEHIRFVAAFCGSQYVSGQKFTVDASERVQERERIWNMYRADTVEPPAKPEFDQFWDRQNGIRSLFIMDELEALPRPCPSREYMRALEWGFPNCVGYRYLSLAQSYLLLRNAGLSTEITARFAEKLVQHSGCTPMGN
jgi:hypothetical protein